MKDEESKRKKKTRKIYYLLQTANHGKKKKAQRAQENVINYDEAQRNKNMPDYTVSGV